MQLKTIQMYWRWNASTTFFSCRLVTLNVTIVFLYLCNVPYAPASPLLDVDVAFVSCAYLMWFRSFADSLLTSNLSSGENDKRRANEREREREKKKDREYDLTGCVTTQFCTLGCLKHVLRGFVVSYDVYCLSVLKLIIIAFLKTTL